MGQKQTWTECPLLADIVAKVFLGWRTKILRAADVLYGRQREGPYRFIQNRSRTSAVALKSDAAAEKSKDQLSRDFPCRSIFDFCNNICQKQRSDVAALLSMPINVDRSSEKPPVAILILWIESDCADLNWKWRSA